MSGRKKVWFDGKVVWVTLPDDIEEDETEPDDLWPDLMLALTCLTEKQRFVIECRYGLRDGREPLDLSDIASLMGVTKQAIEKLETRAIEKMQAWVDPNS